MRFNSQHWRLSSIRQCWYLSGTWLHPRSKLFLSKSAGNWPNCLDFGLCSTFLYEIPVNELKIDSKIIPEIFSKALMRPDWLCFDFVPAKMCEQHSKQIKCLQSCFLFLDIFRKYFQKSFREVLYTLGWGFWTNPRGSSQKVHFARGIASLSSFVKYILQVLFSTIDRRTECWIWNAFKSTWKFLVLRWLKTWLTFPQCLEHQHCSLRPKPATWVLTDACSRKRVDSYCCCRRFHQTPVLSPMSCLSGGNSISSRRSGWVPPCKARNKWHWEQPPAVLSKGSVHQTSAGLHPSIQRFFAICRTVQ